MIALGFATLSLQIGNATSSECRVHSPAMLDRELCRNAVYETQLEAQSLRVCTNVMWNLDGSYGMVS